VSERVFVDTSVLLCAHDLDAGEKRAIAEHVLRTLWTDRSGTLSVQVLEEFYDAFTARAATAAAKRVARDLVEVYSAWRVAALDAADLLAACDHAERYQVHVRDATILVAARKVRATVLLTDSLHHGWHVGGVEIRNPYV
jgi:predicted nucleic acid-binding protein